MRKLMMLLGCLLLSIGYATAQTQKVSGVVLSEEDGSPVIGASVTVIGTTLGTITDIDGHFEILRVPSDSKTMKVSYIGMKTVTVPIKTVMKVVLESDTELLDEVMVVAFGKAKKSAFTGSAATVKSDKIIERQASNVTNALSGQVAGVQALSSNGQPGQGSSIRIRGIGSISASTAPLYVIDGVPFEGELSTLNTQDIESMTVLKDAASNSLYGARGANGVILITTRKGVVGKPVVHVDAKWGSNRRAVPNYDVIKSPSRYYELMYQSLYNSFFKGDPMQAHELANKQIFLEKDGGLGYRVYDFPEGESFIGIDGKLNPNATLGYSDGKNYYRPDNWFDEVFDKGNMRQEYNVNISGANDRINYFMSAGYLGDKGIIPNSDFERFSTRLKADYKVYDWLQVGSNMSYVRTKSSYPRDQTGSSSGNLFYVTNLIAPIYPFYIRGIDEKIKIDDKGFTVYDFGDGKQSQGIRPFMSQSNPASSIELDKRGYKTDFFSGKWFANVSILPDLILSANIGADVTNQRMEFRLNPYYGQFAEVGGILSASSQRVATLNRQLLLTYNFEIDKHALDFLVGYEAFNMRTNVLGGSKEKIYNFDILELDNAINNPSVYSYGDRYSTAGYLGRAQYSYDGKYFGSLSFRRDGSSRFHKDNRWGNFWSIGGGWLMNKESFMEKATWVDMLKFKMSYGVQGNDDLLYTNGVSNYYPYLDQYTLSKQGDGFGLAFSYKGNKDITWETSHSFNTGFDFELFGSRLGGSLEYFSKRTTDMLYYQPTPMSLGYAEIPMNVGSMINRGFEMDLRGVAYQSKDITWDVTFNLTHVKNKIDKLDKSLNGELIKGSRIYREGESLYQLYLRKYAGVDQETGEALYYMDQKNEETGKIERVTTNNWGNATKYTTGDILPKAYGGFGTSLKLYNIDFGISFAYQFGGKVYDNTYAQLMHNGISAGTNWHKDIEKAWTPDNTTSSVPRLNRLDQYSNRLSDRFMVKSNYLSLQNITFGYSFPRKVLNNIGMSGLRLYFVADNVALFSKRKGLDPRQGYASSGNDSYSSMRTISGGVTLTF